MLAVSGVGADLKEALDRAYQGLFTFVVSCALNLCEGVKQIQFDGAQFRTDIAHRALSAAPVPYHSHFCLLCARSYC